jgi:hypothetical protein
LTRTGVLRFVGDDVSHYGATLNSPSHVVGTQRAFVCVFRKGGGQVLYHCWHDVNVKFPGGRFETVAVPTQAGRVCCYCGEVRPQPLPPLRPKRAHGPFVDDDSEWYVVDELECPGLGLIELNAEPGIGPVNHDDVSPIP